MESSSRVDWILANHDLTQRLDHVWSGEAWRDNDTGLAATLDELPDWAGWDAWDPHRQVDELHKLLAQWEHPAEETVPDEQPLSQDTSQPRWNPDTSMWEIYNAERAEWWAYDGDSGNWFDPGAYQWVPYQAGGAAEPEKVSVLVAPDDDFIELDDEDDE